MVIALKTVHFLISERINNKKKHKKQKLYTVYDFHAFYLIAYSNITDNTNF